jgi:hypothetical protein
VNRSLPLTATDITTETHRTATPTLPLSSTDTQDQIESKSSLSTSTAPASSSPSPQPSTVDHRDTHIVEDYIRSLSTDNDNSDTVETKIPLPPNPMTNTSSQLSSSMSALTTVAARSLSSSSSSSSTPAQSMLASLDYVNRRCSKTLMAHKFNIFENDSYTNNKWPWPNYTPIHYSNNENTQAFRIHLLRIALRVGRVPCWALALLEDGWSAEPYSDDALRSMLKILRVELHPTWSPMEQLIWIGMHPIPMRLWHSHELQSASIEYCSRNISMRSSSSDELLIQTLIGPHSWIERARSMITTLLQVHVEYSTEWTKEFPARVSPPPNEFQKYIIPIHYQSLDWIEPSFAFIYTNQSSTQYRYASLMKRNMTISEIQANCHIGRYFEPTVANPHPPDPNPNWHYPSMPNLSQLYGTNIMATPAIIPPVPALPVVNENVHHRT